MAKKKIVTHQDLEVYQKAFHAAMELYECNKSYPKEVRYSLTDQMRRSSRSVTSNLAEAWRKRRYPAAFISKLNDAEGEAAETQVWIEYSVKCGYLKREKAVVVYSDYNEILGTLVGMINHPESWTIQRR